MIGLPRPAHGSTTAPSHKKARSIQQALGGLDLDSWQLELDLQTFRRRREAPAAAGAKRRPLPARSAGRYRREAPAVNARLARTARKIVIGETCIWENMT